MKTEKLLRKIGIGEEKRDLVEDEEKQVEAVLVSSTSNSCIFESLEDHDKESKRQRAEILSEIDLLFDEIKQEDSSDLEDKILELVELINFLLDRVKELQSRIDDLEEAAVSREQYKKLNEELTKFQDDWLFQYIEPAIKKLINLYDDAHHLVQDPEFLRKIVLEILNRLNVRRIDRDSSKYSPKFQKAVETIETYEKSEDKKVKDILSEGFKYLEQRTIRPQKVSIYKFNQQGG